MPLDPAFDDLNRASTERMRALAARLSDEQMQTPVGQQPRMPPFRGDAAANAGREDQQRIDPPLPPAEIASAEQ